MGRITIAEGATVPDLASDHLPEERLALHPRSLTAEELAHLVLCRQCQLAREAAEIQECNTTGGPPRLPSRSR